MAKDFKDLFESWAWAWARMYHSEHCITWTPFLALISTSSCKGCICQSKPHKIHDQCISCLQCNELMRSGKRYMTCSAEIKKGKEKYLLSTMWLTPVGKEEIQTWTGDRFLDGLMDPEKRNGWRWRTDFTILSVGNHKPWKFYISLWTGLCTNALSQAFKF